MASKAATRRLTNLTVKEVSLVRQPANQGARVLFTKSGGNTMSKNATAAALASAAEGFRKAIDAVEVDDAQARSAAVSAGVDQFKKAMAEALGGAAGSGDDVEVLTDVAKAISTIGEELATVKKALATAQASEQTTVATLKAMQDAAAEEKLLAKAAELSKGLVTTAAEIATVLRALPEGPAREAYESSLAKERGNGKLAGLTTVVGSDRASAATDAASASAQIDNIAKEIARSESVPMAKAMELALDRNPELYNKTIQSA